MSYIKRVNGIKKYGKEREWALIEVVLDHGEVAYVWCGGQVEEYPSKYDKPMAHIIRNPIDKQTRVA